MAVLTDIDIKSALSEGSKTPLETNPFEESCLTPIGYDLRVGAKYISSIGEVENEISAGEYLVIAPNSTVLVETLEHVSMPQDRSLSGSICSKVSLVSQGLSHISTTIDSDWKGVLLIALHNHGRYPVSIKHGEKLCTMVLLQNVTPSGKESGHQPKRPYVLIREYRNRASREKKKRRLLRVFYICLVAISLSAIYWLLGKDYIFTTLAASFVAVAPLILSKRNV